MVPVLPALLLQINSGFLGVMLPHPIADAPVLKINVRPLEVEHDRHSAAGGRVALPAEVVHGVTRLSPRLPSVAVRGHRSRPNVVLT